ncbi:MAG: CHAT domain-containing protein [Myxococcota bacterium]
MLIHLRVDRNADGTWRVSLRDRDTRGARGDLSAETAASLLSRASGDLSGGAVVLLPGRDSRQTAAEEAMGRQLAAALSEDSRLAHEWARLIGVSEGREEDLVVIIDVENQQARALPWELLASSPTAPPLESAGGAVLRLAPGRPGRPVRPGPLQTRCWIPQPDDPNVSRIARRLRAICAELNLPAPLPVDPSAVSDSGPMILHFICHGETLTDQLRLLGAGDAEMASGTAVHLLSPLLSQTDLVVLSVCEGGADLPAEMDGLAERLIAAGARAVVSSSGKLSVSAAEAFLSGVYPALRDGASLASAIQAGRRAVRGLASPFPDARWHRLRLLIGDLQSATTSLQPTSEQWHPEGWPTPGPDAAAHLAAVYQIAEALGSGFIGVEHLALALAERPPIAGLEAIRYPLALRIAEIRDGLAQLLPVPGRTSATRLSPRLQAIGAHLPRQFNLAWLWRVVLEQAGPIIQRLSGSSGLVAVAGGQTATVQTWTNLPTRPTTPPDGFEVIGGPEDGRRVFPAAGETIGRWAEPTRSQHCLYEDTQLTDPSLSRRHLAWLGGGRIQLLAPARQIIRQGRIEARSSGEQALVSGDQVWLSRATGLLAIGTG